MLPQYLHFKYQSKVAHFVSDNLESANFLCNTFMSTNFVSTNFMSANLVSAYS